MKEAVRFPGVKIKICNIRDIDTALKLEKLGIDFIGIHMIHAVTEHRVDLLRQCEDLRSTIPVVVTRSEDPAVLREIGKLAPPYLQLHATWTRKRLRSIKDNIPRGTKLICLVAPEEALSIPAAIDELVGECDFLLFDKSNEGGTGATIELDSLRTAVNEARTRGIPFFIAGGLTDKNVSWYVKEFLPFAIDVQSGVEILGAPGAKDLCKITKLVEMARR